MAEWVYFLHPPRDNFAETITDTLIASDAVMLVVFLDKSVLEVYGQNGRVCVTRVIDAWDVVIAGCLPLDRRQSREGLPHRVHIGQP